VGRHPETIDRMGIGKLENWYLNYEPSGWAFLLLQYVNEVGFFIFIAETKIESYEFNNALKKFIHVFEK